MRALALRISITPFIVRETRRHHQGSRASGHHRVDRMAVLRSTALLRIGHIPNQFTPVKVSMIARQFGLSQSEVRKALASEMPERKR